MAINLLSKFDGRAIAKPAQLSEVVPVLQAEDGSFVGSVTVPGAGSNNATNMVASDASGNVRWMVPNEQPLMVTDSGSLIGQSGIVYDGNGNALGQLNGAATQSWTGSDYTVDSSVSSISMPPVLAPAGASFWPQAGGNPSGNGSAALQCPCLLQPGGIVSTGTAPDDSPKRAHDATTSPSGPPTWLILVGDPGQGIYNSGTLFNVAAATEQDRLNGISNLAYPPQRVSSVQEFATQLTSNGPLTGGVVYFGHGGAEQFADGTFGGSQLSPGEQAGVNTNITSQNVGLLSGAQLGPSATIWLHSCHAGFGNRGYPSIAQLIANQLQHAVYAAPGGTFFATNPGATTITPLNLNQGKPLYLIPYTPDRFYLFTPGTSH